MDSQWQNFLRNLGEWGGSFANLDTTGRELERTASILTLSKGDEERLVHFQLRRFSGEQCEGEPIREIRQDYRSLGKQVVFFANGSFSKGSLQLAPATAFGAEFGFVAGDRRHRLVILHDDAGSFGSLVLIREFRLGTEAVERPALTHGAVVGDWQGTATTITADWPVPESVACTLRIEAADGGGLIVRGDQIEEVGAEAACECQQLLLADSGFVRVPRQLNHRRAFSIEALWSPAPGRIDRMIRRYDNSGAWLSSTQILAERL